MTRVSRQSLAIWVMAMVLAASSAVLRAGQQPPVASVFTEQQAEVGKAAFARTCAGCHMPDLSGNNEVPPLTGVTFMSTWGDRTTKEIFDYMLGAMPPGGPSLTSEMYAAITAYILKFNGAIAGSEALTASTVVPIRSVAKRRSTSAP